MGTKATIGEGQNSIVPTHKEYVASTSITTPQ